MNLWLEKKIEQKRRPCDQLLSRLILELDLCALSWMHLIWRYLKILVVLLPETMWCLVKK
ncbi:hypothetical protein Gotri_009412 [Gossypium trilobum]|uniref:Uncharacterized protein n=1 Tax=Gossypium trilobum TaxID=34281 RepID=A0A7J9EMV8_9ROSI|nr:hypothetical protein [Gossypium trilobum]